MADNSQQALAELQSFQSQAQDPNTILSNQRQQLGVNQAQDTVTGLRGAINNTTKLLKQVAPSVMGRTGNSLVTNAQATKQISNEQAPISQNLSDQTNQYNQADQDLQQLQSRAQEAASGLYQQQQDKLSYAQNLYNSLFQREQAAESARQAEADRQEQARQFNAQLAASKSASSKSSGLANLAALLGGGGSSSNASFQQRSDKGYNFQRDNGQSISAAQYAQLTGTPLRSLLQQMANSGDSGAKVALDYVGNDFGVNKAKVGNNQQVRNVLNSILWGVNKI